MNMKDATAIAVGSVYTDRMNQTWTIVRVSPSRETVTMKRATGQGDAVQRCAPTSAVIEGRA